MRRTSGWRRALATGLLALGAAACGPTPTVHRRRPSPAPKPLLIIPAPAGMVDGTTPATNGLMWVLAGTGPERTLRQIDVASRSDQGAVPAPSSAVAVAESVTGQLGVGLATGRTGALEIRNGTTGALQATVPVADPVRAVAAGTNGTTFYVLEGTARAASVATVDLPADRVEGVVPVPLLAVAAIPNPGQYALWVLQANGVVSAVALASGKITTQFSIGDSGRALALSPDGSTLYVLKGRGAVRNVAVVALATESVIHVLPASANALDVVLSPDGGTVYDLVGTSTLGNIQAFRLSR